jgi:hypothetical protein
MARTQQPEVNASNTAAVARYRERQAKQGGSVVYSHISKDATIALQSIKLRKICSNREAIEHALIRYANDLARRR